jgi:hypothetical protein
MVDMKQNMEDLERQKKEADLTLKHYIQKYGSIESEMPTSTE